VDHFLRVGLFGREIIDRHVCALACEGDRGRASHSGIAAGDQRLAPGEPSGAAITLFAVVGTRIHSAGKARPCLRLFLEWRFRIFFRGVGEFGSRHVLISFR
jgi:hypothetical protein